MFPQGSFRNPYYTNPRQQSLGGSRPIPLQAQPQAPSAPEPKKEEQQAPKAPKKAEEPVRAYLRGMRSDQQPSRQPSLQLPEVLIPQPQPQPQRLQPEIPKSQPQPQRLQPEIPKSQPQPQRLQPEIPKSQLQPQADPKKAQQNVPEESNASAPFPKEPIHSIPSFSDADSRAGQMIVPVDNRALVLKESQPAEQHKSLQQGIKEDISNLTRRLSDLHSPQKLSPYGDQKMQDLGVRVITLAGENRGATMDMGSLSRKNDVLDVQGVNHKPNAADKNEEDPDAKHRHSAAGPVNAFVNSNIQAANNSILYNSSCPHRDPGVRLALSNNPISSKEIAPLKEARGKSIVKAAKPSAD